MILLTHTHENIMINIVFFAMKKNFKMVEKY